MRVGAPRSARVWGAWRGIWSRPRARGRGGGKARGEGPAQAGNRAGVTGPRPGAAGAAGAGSGGWGSVFHINQDLDPKFSRANSGRQARSKARVTRDRDAGSRIPAARWQSFNRGSGRNEIARTSRPRTQVLALSRVDYPGALLQSVLRRLTEIPCPGMISPGEIRLSRPRTAQAKQQITSPRATCRVYPRSGLADEAGWPCPGATF